MLATCPAHFILDLFILRYLIQFEPNVRLIVMLGFSCMHFHIYGMYFADLQNRNKFLICV